VTQEVGDATGRVVFHQARSCGGDVGGDVDRMGEEPGDGAGEGFGHGAAEIFLVGGEHEGSGGLEGVPFLIALEHAGPMERIGDAKALNKTHEGSCIGAVHGACHHEAVEGRIPEAFALEGGHSLDEQRD